MQISVIVPTYGRPDSLRRCMAALAAQTRLPDQVLVSVQYGDNATQRSLEELMTLFNNVPITKVTVCGQGKSRAINAALEKNVGDIICFTDDDAEPYEDWIER